MHWEMAILPGAVMHTHSPKGPEEKRGATGFYIYGQCKELS